MQTLFNVCGCGEEDEEVEDNEVTLLQRKPYLFVLVFEVQSPTSGEDELEEEDDGNQTETGCKCCAGARRARLKRRI
eukprot:SAG31_NODE_14321_length_814_cov_0.935664_1_plen_76_part_01